ncbi:hypothetical protein [Pseudonocardia sp. NPDC049154]|uniref:hypothetical protein n=1 Tax=Pseudonocardia sp. NPDC049154 TaxID=3155501 RepID=UPI0033F0E839
MASLTLPTAFPTTVARRRRRPEDGWARWGVRLALSALLVALGVWAGLRGFVSTTNHTNPCSATASSDSAAMPDTDWLAAYATARTANTGRIRPRTVGRSKPRRSSCSPVRCRVTPANSAATRYN